MKNNFWGQIRKSRLACFCITGLIILYLGALFSPFLAPYSSAEQHLGKTYHPPTGFIWKEGRLQVPIYRLKDPSLGLYEHDTTRATPVRFFVHGAKYELLGFIPTDIHLFGVDRKERIYLLGSDATGRCVFSRLLLGSRISLTIGLIGLTVTMTLGLLIGGLAGFYGGWLDGLCMRATELVMAIPSLYLLLTLRSALVDKFPPEHMFFLIVGILSLIGWPGTARVIRGMTLALREQTFVKAAETMGQSPMNIIVRHILPNAFSYLIVSAMLSIPGYILGESALSLLNIGLQEPGASWGLMLAQTQDIKIFKLNFWWLLTPGVAIFIVVILFNLLGDTLRDIVDPKQRTITR